MSIFVSLISAIVVSIVTVIFSKWYDNEAKRKKDLDKLLLITLQILMFSPPIVHTVYIFATKETVDKTFILSLLLNILIIVFLLFFQIRTEQKNMMKALSSHKQNLDSINDLHLAEYQLIEAQKDHNNIKDELAKIKAQIQIYESHNNLLSELKKKGYTDDDINKMINKKK